MKVAYKRKEYGKVSLGEYWEYVWERLSYYSAQKHPFQFHVGLVFSSSSSND